MNINTLIFDLDGTLIDSCESIILTAQQTCQHLKLKIPERNLIERLIGIPMEKAAPIIIDSNDSKLIEEFIRIYRTVYLPENAKFIKTFPGVIEVLSILKNKNFNLGIATSKRYEAAKFNCDSLGLSDFFGIIIGSDLVKNYKPHAESALKVAEYFKSESSRCLVIGDSEFDIQMGQNAKMKTCGITWGASDYDKLSEFNPDHIISDLNKIADIL